eukprot:CAMPEP_0172806130 /NCGR_PEP_ID=MMETSP1075-20121228/6149_1 /TAXON_ID=2916 /ORGANISM="Ceratium fusus, Strain PA161109" /LENGTH=201 /DNA_ID=CAMNT_0013644871 /DNA_START=678 /DNA_END=1280 /DNA_ORIENTATION=-
MHALNVRALVTCKLEVACRLMVPFLLRHERKSAPIVAALAAVHPDFITVLRPNIINSILRAQQWPHATSMSLPTDTCPRKPQLQRTIETLYMLSGIGRPGTRAFCHFLHDGHDQSTVLKGSTMTEVWQTPHTTRGACCTKRPLSWKYWIVRFALQQGHWYSNSLNCRWPEAGVPRDNRDLPCPMQLQYPMSSGPSGSYNLP